MTDAQPAGEHHVGTLDLSGEGNPEPDGQHMPIGIRSTDVGPFIRCSCGTSPSPHHWLATHWPGDKAEGMRLADEVLAAAREASPISDDMVQAAIRAYETFGAGMQAALEAAYPAIREQVAEEIAGRDRVLAILNAHRMHYAYGNDAACLCGWAPSHMRVWYDEHRDHTADMIAAGIGGRGGIATAPGRAGGASGRTGLSASPSDPRTGKAGRSESGGFEG